MKKDYRICIPTYKRYTNIQEMIDVLGTDDILWCFNDDDEAIAYMEAYGKPLDYVIGGSLIGNRNMLLQWCEEANVICVMLDDDLRKVTENKVFNGGEKVVSDPLKAIEEIVEDFKARPQTIAGMSPTSNDFFAQKTSPRRQVLDSKFNVYKTSRIVFRPRDTS